MPLHSNNHPLIQLNAAESALLKTVIALAQDEIGPKANEVAKQDVFAWETFKTLSDNGVIASAFPTSHGGTAASMALRVRIIEELASVCTAAACLVTGTDLSSRPIVGHATEEVKDLVLQDLAWGKKQAAFALTEPAAGSDVAGLLSTYEENANGEFVISGEKKFITRADTADYFVVVARKAGGERFDARRERFVWLCGGQKIAWSFHIRHHPQNGLVWCADCDGDLEKCRRSQNAFAVARGARHGAGARHLNSCSCWSCCNCFGQSTWRFANSQPICQPAHGVWQVCG